MTTRECGTAVGFVLVGQSSGESENVFAVFVPDDTDLKTLVDRNAVSVRVIAGDRIVVRYEDWMKPHLLKSTWKNHGISYEAYTGGQRGTSNWPSNNPMKLSVRPVTPLACASVAPVRPAAYRRRYTHSEKRP